MRIFRKTSTDSKTFQRIYQSFAYFVTSFKNEPIARLMDEGKKLICVKDDPETDPEVKRILDEKDERYTKAPTENMTFPISIYLIEEA